MVRGQRPHARYAYGRRSAPRHHSVHPIGLSVPGGHQARPGPRGRFSSRGNGLGVGAVYRVYLPRLLASNWGYLAVASLVLALGGALGYWLTLRYPLDSYKQFVTLTRKFLDMASRMERETVVGKIAVLLANNLTAALVTEASGLLLVILPAASLAANGMFMGMTCGEFAVRGVGLTRLLGLGVLPHGIFELPGFVVAGAFGMKLGIAVLSFGLGRRGPPIKRSLGQAVAVTLFLVVPMLLVGAVVEVGVTQTLLASRLR